MSENLKPHYVVFDENLHEYFKKRYNNMSAFIRDLMLKEKERLEEMQKVVENKSEYDQILEANKVKSDLAYQEWIKEQKKKEQELSDNEYERLRKLYVSLIESGAKKDDADVQEVLNKMRSLNK